MNKKFLQMIMFSSLLCTSEESFGVCLPAANAAACIENCTAACGRDENNINIITYPSRYCNHLTHNHNPCDCVCLPIFPNSKFKKSEERD